MREYKGQVLLITNVASQCGYTESNYKGLQELYDKYRDRGLQVIHRLQGTGNNSCKGDMHACGWLSSSCAHAERCLYQVQACETQAVAWLLGVK